MAVQSSKSEIHPYKKRILNPTDQNDAGIAAEIIVYESLSLVRLHTIPFSDRKRG